MSIKILDIAQCSLVAEVQPQLGRSNLLHLGYAQFEKLVNEITYVYYDEARLELVTGHEDGTVVLWF